MYTVQSVCVGVCVYYSSCGYISSHLQITFEVIVQKRLQEIKLNLRCVP